MLRSTQQRITVVGANPSSLRAAQFRITVVRNPLADITEHVSESLVLQELVQSNINFGEIEDTLLFEESIWSTPKADSGNDVLTFSETVKTNIKHEQITESLAFSEMNTSSEFDQFIFEQLEFSETVGRNQYHATVSENLIFDEVLDRRGDFWVRVFQAITFEDLVTPGTAVLQQGVGDSLFFTESVSRTVEIEVTDELTFDEVPRNWYGAQETLTFSETISAGKGDTLFDELEFVEEFDRQIDIGRSVSEGLFFTEGVAYRYVKSCNDRDYTPFVGSTNDTNYTPPTTERPVLSSSNVILSFPVNDPTHTVTLNKPEFGNDDVLAFDRINRETRGGTLIVFADPDWPKMQTLRFTFNGLSKTQIRTLREFLSVSLGMEIRLVDYEGRDWRGIITNPDTLASHVHNGDHSVLLDFEGDLITD